MHHPTRKAPEEAVNATLEEADRCVKCGLCLPHCPTYRLHRNENESPRGRIALAEGLLRGELEADRQLRGHIERCLLCRNCETHCPSGVQFTQIIDTAREQLGARAGLVSLFDRPGFAGASRIAGRLPIPGVAGRLARALGPEQESPRSGLYPPQMASRGRIGLLLGCVTREQQAGALQATIRLLNALAYEVLVPEEQACCGALARHRGDRKRAESLLAANRAAFSGCNTVVTVASACSMELRTHAPDLEPADIMTFLAQQLPAPELRFPNPEGAVAVHIPCSLHNGLGETGPLLQLLQELSGRKPVTIANPGECCGAGGSHLLTQRRQAERLREPMLERLEELQPRYLLSTNIGCALHLAEGAASRGIPLEVLHPVEYLARSLVPAR